MAEDVPSISSIQSLILDLPPSCIEFCPTYPDYFLVGTYNLQKDDQEPASCSDHEEDNAGHGGEGEGRDDESENKLIRKPQNRNGSIIVFRLEDRKVYVVQTLAYPSAILDLHFKPISHSSHPARCAIVSSTGTLSTFDLSPLPLEVREDSNVDILSHLATYRFPGEGEDTILTSFCWHPSAPNIAALTTSAGEVHVVRLKENPQSTSDGQLDTLSTIGEANITHMAEAWTVAIAPLPGGSGVVPGKLDQPFVLYSGGDDSMLNYTTCSLKELNSASPDSPSDDEAELQHFKPFTRPVGHTAGVTAILPLDHALSDGTRIVVTGSYDDHLRIFAIGLHSSRPRLLVEQNLGGGVWRLKLMADKKFVASGTSRWRILASCMHAGARVVDIEVGPDGRSRVIVLAKFEEHQSMDYGSDFRAVDNGDGALCVSTSFYDKLLCLWEFLPREGGPGVST